MENSDIRTILANMQREEKELQQKRLYLMGLSDFSSLDDKQRKSRSRNCDFIPESFMREDDVFYEDVKKLVEQRFGVSGADTMSQVVHDDVKFRNFHHMSKVVLAFLDDLSNTGLFHLANIVSEYSATINKTRPCMKKFVKESLEVLPSKQNPTLEAKILSQVSQLLKDQKNFLQNRVGPFSVTLKSHRNIIMKVIDGLEGMPTHALNAMHRKLKGTCGYSPQLCPPRSGWNRIRLIDQIRKLCLTMIGDLSECDELPAPLAKAMDVAGLSSKMVSGYEDLYVPKFIHLSPELEALQNEIFKAIRLLGQKMTKEKLKKVQQLLDPTSKMDCKGIKVGIKNMLIEFLYECSEIDTVPKSLSDSLCVINDASLRWPSLKDQIEQEVEGILNLSSATKQILLDYIPNDMLDQDYADAYMELEESDDGDILDDDDYGDDNLVVFTNSMNEVQVELNDFNEEVQSNRDPEEVQSDRDSEDESFGLSLLALENANESCSPQGWEMVISESNERSLNVDSPNSQEYNNQMPVHQKNKKNMYLELQKVSDQASLAACELIGHIMDEFIKMKELKLSCDDNSCISGKRRAPEQYEDPAAVSLSKDERTSAFIRAVQKVRPSFSSSDMEDLKKILNS